MSRNRHALLRFEFALGLSDRHRRPICMRVSTITLEGVDVDNFTTRTSCQWLVDFFETDIDRQEMC